jgi:hypothetical protein
MEMAMAMETGMESRGCNVAVRSHRVQTWVRVQGEYVVEGRSGSGGGLEGRDHRRRQGVNYLI